MIRPIRTTALAAVITLALTACGGGSGGDNTASGVGGSGYISSGTVTGFGSVFVNGVEFNTDNSTFDIEGDSSGKTQSDLAIGMVVRVNGTINGTTGNATSIIFDDELQGPVSVLTAISATTTSASFTVLGTTVKIDRSSTYFDGTGFSFDGIDGIANGDNVEISGFFDASGTLIASRVELKEPFLADSSIVEIKGNLLTTDDINYTLNGLAISISGLTNIDDLPNGLSNGIPVQVKGTFNGVNTIAATKIESEELELSDSDEFELEGYITDFVDSSNFKINGIPVDASRNSTTLIPSNITLANDLKVEAEGSIVGGILIATELKLRGGDVEIKASVTEIDPINNPNTFKVSPVLGQSITIIVGTETEYESELSDIEPFRLADIINGNFVEIEGFEDTDAITGTVFASQVKIVDFADADGIEVQANIDETTDNEVIIVLGVAFDVTTATFEDSDDNSIANEALFNDAADLNPLISVTAASDDGVAVKVELE